MKKVFFMLILTLPYLGSAQDIPVVIAPATNTILTEEAAESKVRFVDRMKLALQDNKLLLDARKAIKKVSAAVQTSVQVKRLTEHQKECYQTIEWVVNDIDINNYANVLVEDSATEIIDLSLELEENISSTTAILSSDFYEMKDYERLQFLRDLNAEVTEIENKLYRLKRKNKRYNDLYRYYNELAKK